MRDLSIATVFSLLMTVLCTSLGAHADPGPISNPVGPRSITELATLSNILIHHYECTADLLLSPASLNREVKFNVQPLVKGETGPAQVMQLQADKLIASANGQMLSLEWTRNGRAIATVKTMILDSPQRNYNLIAVDPSNPEQQAQIYCNGITFAQNAAAGK